MGRDGIAGLHLGAALAAFGAVMGGASPARAQPVSRAGHTAEHVCRAT